MTNWPRCRSCNCYLVSLTDGPRCRKCSEIRIMLFWIALITLGFLILCARARGGVVTEEFLDRVAWTESRNNPAARGKHGELGAWQLKAIAVTEVNRIWGWRLRHQDVCNPVVGRAAAQAYCLTLERALVRGLGRQPSQVELYRAYRLGAAGFMRSIAAGPFCTPRQNPACAGRGNDFTQGAKVASEPHKLALVGAIPTPAPISPSASWRRSAEKASEPLGQGNAAPLVNAPGHPEPGSTISPTTPRTGASATDGRVGVIK